MWYLCLSFLTSLTKPVPPIPPQRRVSFSRVLTSSPPPITCPDLTFLLWNIHIPFIPYSSPGRILPRTRFFMHCLGPCPPGFCGFDLSRTSHKHFNWRNLGQISRFLDPGLLSDAPLVSLTRFGHTLCPTSHLLYRTRFSPCPRLLPKVFLEASFLLR